MSGKQATLVTLFADISNSTGLYEVLGDTAAYRKLAACIDTLAETVRRHEGTVIKTIGDEVMATFPLPDPALEAACAMQAAIGGRSQAGSSDLAIHVGFHYGSVVLENNDVFGDAVNVAARMTTWAKEGQIITTKGTVAFLSAPLKARTRRLFRAPVKGRQEAIEIFEVIWQKTDMTFIDSTTVPLIPPVKQVLRLSHQNQFHVVDENRRLLTLGREADNDLVIDQPSISRRHARIEYLAGRFVLSDHSTNGTYVLMEGSPGIFLRRDSLTLLGAGKICFQRNEGATPEAFVPFQCHSPSE